jgi:allophanate hydrolase
MKIDIGEIFARIRREGERPVWISLADENEAVARAECVDPSLPLAGVPFAVKDNIDVEGMFTTAGCPAFAYKASRTAPVVQRLMDAGAILIGKTNMDQFATGLVGVRSPYGACSSAFDSRYISGGSSSGSAAAVAKDLCGFALGTDTAGSGRVPAAFNNLVGFKPTRGLLSTTGVVPACRSLDCVSIFAKTAAQAAAVWDAAHGFDPSDPYSRTLAPGPSFGRSFRFGVPDDSLLKFFGDLETPLLYRQAIHKLERLGGVRTTIDYDVFRETAALLYSGPWVAERFAAVGDFLMRESEGVHPVVAGIIKGASKYSAVDVYRSMYRLEELKRGAAGEWALMDVLLLPTAGTIYTIEAVEADPTQLNSNLGYYTNFVNLLDLAAVAIPSGFRGDGLPFGVSLIGPAFSDRALLELAQRVLGEPSGERPEEPAHSGFVALAVVGAHLSGQPLNHQLTGRGARLVKSCRTAPDYRLFALNGATPPKPGLIREPGFTGWGIEVEVWSVPEHEFGGFVAAIPSPLVIGNVQLDEGEIVKGFLCEPWAAAGADEITRFGGWRNYLLNGNSSPRTTVPFFS